MNNSKVTVTLWFMLVLLQTSTIKQKNTEKAKYLCFSVSVRIGAYIFDKYWGTSKVALKREENKKQTRYLDWNLNQNKLAYIVRFLLSSPWSILFCCIIYLNSILEILWNFCYLHVLFYEIEVIHYSLCCTSIYART